MANTVDARGLSCPQPVLMTLKEMESMEKGQLVVLVDNDTSKENVIRAAESKGWKAKHIQAEGKEYRLTIIKE
jgi:tRNA 2-thiouridine synthesizing protein A